jgi:hypothetical protein
LSFTSQYLLIKVLTYTIKVGLFAFIDPAELRPANQNPVLLLLMYRAPSGAAEMIAAA